MKRVERTARRAAWIAAIATVVALLASSFRTRAGETERARPRPVQAQSTAHPVDEFHPDRGAKADGTRPPMPAPAYGGRVIVHMETMPKSLNGALDNPAVVRRIAYETNETLLLRDWNTQVLQPDLCTGWDVEDQVVPEAGAPVFGHLTEDGDEIVVTAVSPENPLKAPVRLPKSARVDRRTVFTFHLREDVVWHDGHPFDARDVDFSLSLYKNKSVKCDNKRFQFEKVVRSEVLSPHAIRVTWSEPYFMAEASIGDMFILPSHLYDLGDPDNAKADPGYRAAKIAADPAWKPTPEEQGEYINANPHNQQFIGLGPYKVTAFTNDYVEATRFDRYFDPARAGFLDTLRWRAVTDMSAAFRAFVAGELDFSDTVASDDYYSATADSKAFNERAYRGLHETSSYWYVGWNLARPQLADPRVRRAIAHLFDFEEFKNTYYRGRADQITGPFPISSPAYDDDVKPYPYDPSKAVQMLTEAGWYDRDGDGLIDHDGQPLSIELLMQSGNPVNQAFGAKLQENLARVGIRLSLSQMELKALIEKRDTGAFDAFALGWAPPFETDPGQIWHSVAPGAKKSSNYTGFADAETDRLIETGRREQDPVKRAEIWRAIHRRVYELQPYLFCYNPPRKYVMIRALRGFQSVPLDPNYVLRRWYYPAGTPGTRATAAVKQG